MAEVTTSHYKIYDFWKDKAITPKGNVINTRDSHTLDDKIAVDDPYVPRCWGCGQPVVRDSQLDKWIDKTSGEGDENEQLKNLWNSKEVKHKFNRCHIVPGALGGKDEPSNLFLMCGECHHLSPDTIYVSSFFKWVLQRRKQMLWGKLHPNYALEQIDKMLQQDYNVTFMELLNKIHELGGDDRIKDTKNDLMNKIGTHCSGISESTWIVGMTKWLMSIYIDLILEQ